MTDMPNTPRPQQSPDYEPPAIVSREPIREPVIGSVGGSGVCTVP